MNTGELNVVDWAEYGKSRNLSRNRLLHAHHADMVERFVNDFGRRDRGEHTLEIGPANGLFSVLLRELGYKDVSGLEISSVFLEELESKGVRAVHGDITDQDGLGNHAQQYDCVLIMEVLEHLNEPLDALANTNPLMCPEGVLYVTVPIRDCLFDRLRRLKNRNNREQVVLDHDPTHVHAFSRESLIRLIEEAGFEIIQTRRVGWTPPARLAEGRAHHLLAALMPERLKGCFLVVEAKRPSSE